MAGDQKPSPNIDLNAILTLMPTKWQQLLPKIFQIGGFIAGGLAFGYQKIALDNPDMASAIPGAPTYLALAGLGAAWYGMISHGNLTKQANDATKIAAMMPPAKLDGTMCAAHTFSVAMQQASSSGPDGRLLAKAVLDAIVAHETDCHSERGTK